ncbi:MAG: 4-alpha-glucanotransferase [Paracoccaceae bacterium]
MTAIDRLAARLGVLPEYHQVDGTHRPTSTETAAALLRAMGWPSEPAGAAEALAALEAEGAARTLPRVILLDAARAARRALPAWTLELEDGGLLAADPHDPCRLPPLPMGVHRMHAGRDKALVIASPPAAPRLAELGGTERAWGITGAIYALRSDRNAGVGDYADLAAAADALGRQGAAFLGINPLHARGAADAGESPYSPSSRTGFDTGHIALDRLPGLAASETARRLLTEAEPRLAAARAAPLVTRGARREIAEPVLRAVFAGFEAAMSAEAARFGAWSAARPALAARQSVYEALSLRHGGDSRHWPAPLQDPDSAETRAFEAEHAAEIRFHEWLQWLAEGQLADAQGAARGAGMALGLYLDIAVGVRPGGAETWAARALGPTPGVFATGASLGAPPDLLNAFGQAWDLAPYTPDGLLAADFAPFRAMLRTTMAHAGMVRIDHVIGFAQSFWVPNDGAPGGYVRFPLETLLALTRIEAHRAGCLVVGEDLGTVPAGLRTALAGSGLLGCAILPFERAEDGFAAPWAYRPETLASFGTHDLPSIAGWWNGADIALRARIGHLSEDEAERAGWLRGEDRARLAARLAAEGVWPDGLDAGDPPVPCPPEVVDAVHALLGAGASALVAVSLDDCFLVEEQQNLPGTIDEVPNWRRPAPVAVEAMAEAPEIARAAEILGRIRPPVPEEPAR